MDIDQAIEHAEQEAHSNRGRDCGTEHRQLAKWLRELKAYRKRYSQGVSEEQMLEAIQDTGALQADGFEDAIVGYIERFNSGPLILHNRERCIEILMERDGMSRTEAEDFFGYNTMGAWVGDGTPAFATFLEIKGA